MTHEPDPHGGTVVSGGTGDAGVDAALAPLADLDASTSPQQQAEVLERVHEALRQRLGATEG